MKWFAQAPANIALIKYMGKADPKANKPCNSSLSYALPQLESFTELEINPNGHDIWEPLELPGLGIPFQLSQKGQARYLAHLQFLKQHWQHNSGFIVRSCNNFPKNSGLASSASSFAALTKCAARAICEQKQQTEPSHIELAELSRQGSGSSCRSFFTPWALWTADTLQTIDIPYPKLVHQVVIVDHESKKVPSSEAHRRVVTSPLFADRPRRAEENLAALLMAFGQNDWQHAFEIVWREFHDMHALFHTAAEPFSYLTNDSKDILATMQKVWEQHGDGPLVTMDAGPNVHLLYRPEQKEFAEAIKRDHFVGNYDVM